LVRHKPGRFFWNGPWSARQIHAAQAANQEMYMTRQLSFTKYEQEILPQFRRQCSTAESTEDVKKFFSYSSQRLLQNVFEDKVRFRYDDIALQPGHDPFYLINDRLMGSDRFREVWEHSDLPRLVKNLARSAVNRFRHLEKNPEKTNKKIRM